jgi:WD40 repeat protein
VLKEDGSPASCILPLKCCGVNAFHPSGRYLATGSFDRSVKLWALNEDCSAETCVLTLKGGDFF